MEQVPNKDAGVPLGSLSDPPNAITASRLVVTVLCFVALSLGWYHSAFVLFVLASATDWADGYWARRWGPITKLGRVLDPLADKLLICGVFTYMSAVPDSFVAPWMAIVVLARELLVTTLRAMVEASGGDFSAVSIGKWKFVAQVVSAGLCLLERTTWHVTEGGPLIQPWWIQLAMVTMLTITLISGVTYTHAAIQALRTDQPEQP